MDISNKLKRFATATVAGVCLSASALYAAEPTAYYPLDTNASDARGQLDGTVYGASFTDGICGGAAKFDGFDDFIRIPSQSLGDYTVSAWFKMTRDTGTWQRIWDFGGTNGGGGDMFLAANHGRRHSSIGVGIHRPSDARLAEDIGTGVMPTLNEWYHVAVSYDKHGDGIKIYVNGELKGEGSYNQTSFEDFTSNNWFLAKSNWRDPNFAGLIDEVAIYAEALSADEISYLNQNHCGLQDGDNDGIPNDLDVCPGYDDNIDSDFDGLPDGCDSCPADDQNDIDGDGVCGNLDVCPFDADPNQLDSDFDGMGNVCDDDDDNDLVVDSYDNCPLDANSDQRDTDGNGVGDACDTDDDGDNVLDDLDQCPTTAVGSTVNEEGCSVADTCPCNANWKNHGQYVKCVNKTTKTFIELGLIEEAQFDEIVSEAAKSSCGRKGR